MADHRGRDETVDGDGMSDGPEHGEDPGRWARPEESEEVSREAGSPLGTDPQDATPLPGDPREPQEPQEPRSSHTAPGRTGDESHPSRATDHQEGGDESDQSVVDHLRDAWDRMRGKK